MQMAWQFSHFSADMFWPWRAVHGRHLSPAHPLLQQANVLRAHTALRVSQYSGDVGADLWDIARWQREFESNDVWVMTPQVLLNILRHAFIKVSHAVSRTVCSWLPVQDCSIHLSCEFDCPDCCCLAACGHSNTTDGPRGVCILWAAGGWLQRAPHKQLTAVLPLCELLPFCLLYHILSGHCRSPAMADLPAPFSIPCSTPSTEAL